MSVIFNEKGVSAEELPGGIRRQRLIDADRVEGAVCRFDRLTVEAGGGAEFRLGDSEIVWGQMLEGTVTLNGPDRSYELSASHVVFLPPGFEGSLYSSKGAILITLTVPDAERFDSSIAGNALDVQCVDLEEEPVLQSEHDARTRIYVATKKLFGTSALVGELVAFPPGTTSSNHHHTGAEHFQYMLRGQATVFLDEQPTRIRAGDLVYKYDLERHYCTNDGNDEMAFVEFFIPGQYDTVWVNESTRCAWEPTGKNLRGGEPTRTMAKHTSDGTLYEDV
ncbi:MAG: cupin domain-containing protein [Candidatus Rariloculaceae bacterium]